MSEFETYRRTGTIEARPYEPGEDLSGISVSEADDPKVGGMICRNSERPEDQWYVNREYFKEHYAPALPPSDETPVFDSHEAFCRAFGLREDQVFQYVRSYVKSFDGEEKSVPLVLSDLADLCLLEILILIEEEAGETWEERLLEEARYRLKAFRAHRVQRNRKDAELADVVRHSDDVMMLAGTQPTYEWLKDAADRHDLDLPIEQSPIANQE